jgi:uncharacterized membrane protein
MKSAFACLLILMLICSSFAEEELPPPAPSGNNFVLITLRDAQGAPIAGASVSFTFSNEKSGELVRTMSETSSRGIAKVLLDDGDYDAIAEVDMPSTPGKDYAAAFLLHVDGDGNASAGMYPVASAKITVKDKDGSLMPIAPVSIECLSTPSIFGSSFPPGTFNFTTDASGYAIARYVPVGACYAVSRRGELVGSADLILKQGELADVELVMENQVAQDSGAIIAAAGIFAIMVAFFAFVRLMQQNREEKEKAAAGKIYSAQGAGKEHAMHGEKTFADMGAAAYPPAGKLPAPTAAPAISHAVHSSKKSRAHKKTKAKKAAPMHEEKNEKLEGILKTLSERERKIVELLQKNNGRLKQSRIYVTLLIPKASLSRTLQALERKNIVKLTPFGKSKVVELEGWLQK